MKRIIQHIALIFALLLLGGIANEAWADVTYIILTKPFSVKNSDNTTYKWTNIRLEALRCTSTETTVRLPDAFRSPLAKNFQYWRTAAVTANTKLYDDTGTSPKVLQTGYDIYTAVSTELTENDPVPDGVATIYVTYDYNEDNTILKLDGAHKYNIALNSGNNLRYLCFNKNRNNRPAAALATTVSAEDLISDDFVTNVNGFDGTRMVHYQFYLCGEDPYNITIMTAYEGDGTYTETLAVEKTAYKKPYRGSTIFAKLQSNNNNDGTANMWLSPDAHRHYKSTTDATVYDSWEGFYKSDMNPIFNAVAVLPKGSGYFFVASKLNQNGKIYQPNASGYYATLSDDGKNPRMIFKAISSAVPMEPDPVTTYTFNVKTSFGNTISATAEWSDAYIDAEITTSHIPESLKRKYCSFVGFYKDAALTQAITKFSDVPADGNIYVKYEVSGAPFTAISPSASYTTATWYELTDKDSSGKKIRWDATNSVFKNNGGASTYEKISEFAFVGDPYELRVIYRNKTEEEKGKHYVGAATVSAGTALGFSDTAGDGYKWEIPDDGTVGNFVLRQYGSGETTPMYWKWNTSEGNSVTINTTSTRVKVMELPQFTYTYNIVDLAGNIAIKATAVQTIFTPISGYASIPETIRSPFLADETITYYRTFSAGTCSNVIEETLDAAADIYVKYTTTNLSSKTINLSDGQSFNVKLNGEFIYWDSTNGVISKKTPTSVELANDVYTWKLTGLDPYAMKIYNMGKGTGEYVKVTSWTNDQSLDFDPDAAVASRFIAMMGKYSGVYEVLAATGTSDFYHIGRASTDGAETKIYSIDTEHGGYAHGADQLRFELFGTITITYTLIDKAKNELFTVTSKNARLALPSEYQSPLVDTYYYYPTKANALTDNHSDNINEITNDTNESDGTPADNHVWVTYTVNDLVSFNTSSSTKNNPYLLRFHNGKSYHLEDGNDELTTGDKIKAMYPYCNGDGNLNVYGEAMRDEQMEGGTSTRSRWQWFFESANSDPYHVKIHSNNQITTPLGKDYTYLHTYAVHFNQDADPSTTHIVTGSTLPGVWKPATEYMVLGTAGNYKLLTTDAVPIDLNDDGDTEDEGESAGERQYVTSFEQYWKTYNMIKQCVLGIKVDTDENYEDFFSENPEDYIMPSELWATLKTKLGSGEGNLDISDSDDLYYVDGCSWHSYTTVASAVRWNGNNTATSKSKVVEKLEHWFQSFDMDDGTFAIEKGDMPPVLILLDRHGWEIMRKPIPMGSSDPETETKLDALKVFDSPMVKEYKFYSNANKVSNCHKYHLRMQGGAERDPIKVGGVQFTSTSLGTLPPYVADRDLFVTYTVKEEYDKSYTYNYLDEATSTASAFIVLQNHQYASDESSTLTANSAPANLSDEIIADADKAEGSKTFKQKCLWYLQPNLEIDDEMGIEWPWSEAGSLSTKHTKEETIVLFKDKTGFDPYNLQLKNVSTGKFFTIDMKKSVLSGGVYTGDYTGGSLNVTLADECTSPTESPDSYDHSKLQMTNQTFMAVQDENGNMQLMPRFDHSHRINVFTILADPLTNATKAAVDDASPGAQTTFLVRPQVFDYKVIDNQGNVALRYKTGGEFYPSMPEHFKSPLATDFKFYKTLLDSNSDGVYELASLDDEITSSFAAAGIMDNADIYIRYDYNDTYDTDNQNILQGQWLTMSLGAKDVQATGTLSTTDGTGISLYTGTKDASVNKWQWKFLQSPMASTSELYVAPDPYRVIISNREANNDDPTASPSKMATAIKVSGKDKFVILSHPSGDYALCAAGADLTYSFLNGGSMTEPSTTAASVEEEGSFTKTSNTISAGARIIFTEDVTHTYTYYIINNSSKLAASETQDNATALSNEFKPVVPYNIQSPLINNDDYLFYGTAKISGDTYTIDSDVEKFIIDNLYGLFDDKIYVRYPEFKRENTPYMVPNARNATSPTPANVEVDSGSNDVAIDINGNLPYNIIWLSDNMMTSSDGSAISDGGCHNLSGETADKWHFTGNDPYAIKIKHDSGEMYVDGDGSLNATAKNYMLLKKDGYDYGVFAETGNQANMLTFSDPGTGYTLNTTTSDPAKFIPFALSVHHLIYRLIIAKSCANHASPDTGESVDIPYRTGDENTYQTSGTWSDQMTTIYGSTQRDLSSTTTVTGDTYQLGRTIYFYNGSSTEGKTYCYDAGKVSLGDVLEVPSELKRPNCKYSYYVQDIYDNYNEEYDASTPANTGGTDKRCEGLNTDLNNKYKGLKMDDNNPVFIKKSDLIGKTVVVNITYDFDAGLETNSGTGFVTDVSQNRWYTWEAIAATPKLAQYTGSLQTQSGYATHYTNDYLWTPLGDPYGFKMYNRYLYKNLSNSSVMTSSVMTSTTVSVEGTDILMSTENTANSVYELLASNTAGYFRVHPVVNTGATKYFMRDDNGTLKLSTTATEWTYGLSEDVMRPYYEGAGNVGGLNAAGKAAYETEAARTNPLERLMGIQDVVYNHDLADDNPNNYIVHYTPGYYRLHNQPGSEGISTIRYASGYLHDIEKTAVSGGIPMHFYSRAGTSTTFAGEGGLGSGFTSTAATQGEIPVPATEYDPSTIFYFSGSSGSINISTQGLNVLGNKMTTGAGTAFTITDIGGGVVALNGTGPTYLRYDQSSNIYDLKYTTAGDESSRWCMEPANKQGLLIETHSGGDGYYYSTFCAPYDVTLPTDAGGKTYNAYVCTTWNTDNIHPTSIGKTITAGTPAIIRTTDTSGSVKVTLPGTASSAASCVFTGKYLEQLLATITADDKVYTFGLPITGYNLSVAGDATNGEVTNPLEGSEPAYTGVGFYLNATKNKEKSATSGEWTPNNRYVLHNKIYYRSGSSGSSAREQTDSEAPQFVPVIFDFDGEEEEGSIEEGLTPRMQGDNHVYDLSGRCVATPEQVADGSWWQNLSHGIYILNGKKIRK